MDTMHEIAQRAIEMMPPPTRFRSADAAVITKHKDTLFSLEAEIVKAFFDTLYAHGPTRAVFMEGERPIRERTLANWWQRTVGGPFDDEYFAWMAMVGLVHVVRNVGNPMMIAMSSFIVDFVAAKAAEDGFADDEAAALVEAFRRLMATVDSIVTHGYDEAVVAALYSVAGMPEALLRRLRDREVAEALTVARTQP